MRCHRSDRAECATIVIVTSTPDVHLLAGLNAAGKSTYARQLQQSLPAVRFTLDEWMLRLHNLSYDDPDYPAAAATCRELIWDTAVQVLRTGAPVILDWNLWSRERRAEWVDRAAWIGATCLLHYVKVPLQTALDQALMRTGNTTHKLSPNAIRHLAQLFEPPTKDEGFVLETVTQDGHLEG